MSIYTLANLAKNAGLENLTTEENIIKEFKEEITYLKSIEETVLEGNISILPIHTVNEGYGITLETLSEAANVQEISLKDSMALLKNVNNIDESETMCVLPENIKDMVTVEEFCDLVEYLQESDITVAWTQELIAEEFITEEGKIKNVVEKIKEKFKAMNVASLEKQIKKCEENNKALEAEIKKIEAMSAEEAKKYVTKQSTKNIGILSALYAGAIAIGSTSGVLLVYKPLIGFPYYVSALVGISKVSSDLAHKDKANINFDTKKYIKAINNTIKLNNKTIKQCEKEIKAKSKK